MAWLWLGLMVLAGLFLAVSLTGAPYVPSHRRSVVEAFTELRPLTSSDTLVDIGSGDGIVCLVAAQQGARPRPPAHGGGGIRHTWRCSVPEPGVLHMSTTVDHPLPDDTGRRCPEELWDLGGKATARARRWADESASQPVPRSARLLARILSDPEGLGFTTRFVDNVVRPADLDVASRALARLSAERTDFLPRSLGAAMGLGSRAARLAPHAVTTMACRVFREIVGDLVVDATDRSLAPALARLRAGGDRLNVNLLGEAVLGDKEASRRLAEVSRLVTREDVDYVSVKVSAVTGPHNPWGFDEVVAHGVEVLSPLYRLARDHGTFINLDMEDYKDLDLTIAVFTAILDQEDLAAYEAGIVLQAYLPDSRGAYQGARGQGRQPVHGAGRCRPPRLGAGHLADQAGHGYELQATPRSGHDPRAHPRRPPGSGGAEPVRYRFRP